MYDPSLTFTVFEVLPEKIYDFEIRSYRRTELAELFHPEVTGEKAWKRFRYELHLCRDLRSALRDAGYDSKRRSLTRTISLNSVLQSATIPSHYIWFRMRRGH